MKFPTVKTFLFCMSLKTGGYIIGWITIFVSLVSLIVLVISMIGISLNPEEYINRIGIIAWMIILNFYTIYVILLIFTACIMMRGILKCNSSKIIPFMICTILGFVFGFVQVCAIGWKGIFPALLGAFADFYSFLIMYSLYKKLKDEESQHYSYNQRVSAISRD